MYDRVNEPHREFLEDLITTHVTDDFYRAVIAGKYKLYKKTTPPRLNIDMNLTANLNRYVESCPTVVITIVFSPVSALV